MILDLCSLPSLGWACRAFRSLPRNACKQTKRGGPTSLTTALDIQQEMLDHTMHRARARGVSNVVPRLGDAQALPYPDDHFDSAYLVATLGEVPDKGRALRELRRVLKRGGRLVVGEVLLDPHKVTFGELRRLTDAGGLDHERTLKGALGYFAAFRAT